MSSTFEFYRSWMEFFLIIVMIIGLILALLVPSAALSYVLVFVSGMFAGRLVYERKNNIVFPYLVIIAAFLIGYLIGVRYGNRYIDVFLFVVAAIISYNLFDKKILKDFRF